MDLLEKQRRGRTSIEVVMDERVVLVVDDEDLVRALLGRTLAAAGLRVRAAGGEEALAYARGHAAEVGVALLGAAG
jgi:CheY-like chemotaxis protein